MKELLQTSQGLLHVIILSFSYFLVSFLLESIRSFFSRGFFLLVNRKVTFQSEFFCSKKEKFDPYFPECFLQFEIGTFILNARTHAHAIGVPHLLNDCVGVSR